MSSPEEKVQMVQTYFEERKKESIQLIEPMLADNCVLVHVQDGTFEGKKAILEYLKKAPYTGEWQKPYYNESTNTVLIPGTVRKFFINWSLRGEFFFENGKIIKIVLEKA
jgi:hypothetical protein